MLGTLLTLNLLLLAWRLLAVGQAFLDTRWHGPTGRLGIVGLALIMVLLVACPHGVAYRYGTALGDTFAKVFSRRPWARPSDRRSPAPGLDATSGSTSCSSASTSCRRRTATLTDTMMVVSLDPVGKTVSILSLPARPHRRPARQRRRLRAEAQLADVVCRSPPRRVPGRRDRRPRARRRRRCSTSTIHYYAQLDFYGFIDMVDAVGGVDIEVAEGFDDPTYDGFGPRSRGWSHHRPARITSTASNALAYARSRKAARRERLHPRGPPAAGPPRAARRR